MAPAPGAKRQRAATDADSLNVVSAAGSSRNPASRKKPRLSAVADGDDDSIDGRNGYASEDSENGSGSGSSVGDEDMGQDTFHATQAYYTEQWDKQKQQNARNVEADDGIVEEIKCVNFMCHDKLTVPIGPNINFIIGHNGSGKSAVLTALTLCLGGKAAATNRGQSLKNFIKEGRDHSMLSVRIKNQGLGAFMPETYGKSIIVERHFTKTGSSSFKIKNEYGKTITTKKGDLDDIIDHFAFSLDNPMNVLTQDMARQFLNQSTPADKYKFFIKGTQLETLDQDYQMTTDFLTRLESRMETLIENCDVLKQKYTEAEKKFRLSDKLETFRDKMRNYQRQMAWVQVEKQEKHLVAIEQNREEADAKIQRLEGEVQTASNNFTAADESYTRKTDQLDELKNSLNPVNVMKGEIKEKFEDNKKELFDLQAQQRDIRGQIAQAKKDIERFNREITMERQRQEDMNGAGHAQRLSELEDAKQAIQRAKAELEEHQRVSVELSKACDEALNQVKANRPRLDAKRGEVREHTTLINELSQAQGRWQKAFDPKLPSLLTAIKEETRFRVTPVGPIGRSLQLMDSKWSSILEKSFGGLLNAFVVTNKSDQNLLSELMRRTNCSSQILIGDPDPIDYSRNKPASHLKTILDVLKIDSSLVRNQLIINQAVEQSVLFNSREEANQFMFPSGGGRPENVKVCFAPNPYKQGAGYRMSYTGAGSEQVAPVHPFGGNPRMQTDLAERLRAERENHRTLTEGLQSAESCSRELDVKLKGCNEAMTKHNRASKELKIKQQRAEERVDVLRDELEQNMPQAGTITVLESQLQDAKENDQIQQEAYLDSVDAKDKLNLTQRDLKSRLDNVQKDVDEIDAKIAKVDASLKETDLARNRALREKNHVLECLQDAETDKTQLEAAHQTQHAEIQYYIEEATKISNRVNVDEGETLESLETKWEKMRRDLERNESQLGGSRDQLSRLALEAKTKWEAEKNEVKAYESLAKSLKESIINRKERWRLFRHHITALAKIHFSYLLSQRKFRGELRVDSKAKLLDIQVEPDITKNNAKGRQAKTLSGGEKSFSTICLLLAIWDAMGSPIRCLDEFDVFMDNVNRQVSMKMMIEAARSSVSRQFILITPQAMNSVAAGDDVKIIKMADPERGQTTLPYTAP